MICICPDQPQTAPGMNLGAAAGLCGEVIVSYSCSVVCQIPNHPEESEREAKLQQIQKANSRGIRLVKMYPVYQGETEAQAYQRAVKEEMQRKE